MAIFSSGEIVSDDSVRDWYENAREPKIQQRRFFDEADPIRLLRDTTLECKLAGPFVEMANGDVVLGRLSGIFPADNQQGFPSRGVIELTPPWKPGGDRQKEIWVRPEYIVRAVYRRAAPSATSPGTLVFADGRSESVRSMRFTTVGVRALTASGGFLAKYEEIAAAHLPADKQITPINAVLDDARAPCTDAASPLARLTTTGGGALTYRAKMLQWKHEGEPLHLVQPAWSWHALAVPVSDIVSYSFREPRQIPLSLLPAETVEQRSYTGFLWPWRRNKSVRGGELSCGQLVSDLGIGNHSYSAVAFQLPDGTERFSAWVGINSNVEGGGCAKSEIYRDRLGGRRLWQSGFLRGGEDPARIDLGGLYGAKRLVLVTDFGTHGRPPGADAFDIRDEVDWLMPSVTLRHPVAPSTNDDLSSRIPQLAGWQIGDTNRDKIQLQPYWHKDLGSWMTSMQVRGERQHEPTDVLMELVRHVVITPSMSWLEISAGRDDNGRGGNAVGVRVDDEPFGAIINGDVSTSSGGGRFDSRKWRFGRLAGRRVKLAVVVYPRSGGNYEASGVLWDKLKLGPTILGLPADGQPIKPEVSISALDVVDAQLRAGHQLKKGTLTNGKPLVVQGWSFDDGYGLYDGEQISYQLKPEWQRFVAVIGLADGWQGAGPFEILLDDELYWSTAQPLEFEVIRPKLARLDPCQQINVPIPPGHKKITFRMKATNSAGGWASAGFLLQK